MKSVPPFLIQFTLFLVFFESAHGTHVFNSNEKVPRNAIVRRTEMTPLDCWVNEHFVSCGPEAHCEISCANRFSPPNCRNPNPKFKCSFPRCICNNGYIRAPNRICIRPQECANFPEIAQPDTIPTVCHENEQYHYCGKDCEKTCVDILFGKATADCNCVNHQPGCICKEGYGRANDELPCVPEADCSSYVAVQPPASANENCSFAATSTKAPEFATVSGNCGDVDCGEHGRCESLNGTQTSCICQDYYDGLLCEQFKPIEYAARFDGEVFIVFSADEFPHMTSEKEEVIELTFKTSASNGVLIWQGQGPETPIGSEDFVSLGLDDGYLVFSYELGGGAAHIISKHPVDDNNAHTVRLTRKGRFGKMFLDDKEPITGSSSGILAMLNVDGNIYLGGLPNLELMTGGLHQGNFVGCVAEFALNGEKMDFMANAVEGKNVRPCDEW